MAKFDFKVSDQFLKTLGRLADVDKVAPKMVEEALPICANSLVSAIELKIDKEHNYSTGEMVASIKPSKVGQNDKGEWYGIARPTGKDRKGVRNMEKLAYFEYGTHKKKMRKTKSNIAEWSKREYRQPPRPVIDKARNDAREPAKASMAATFKREMKL